MTALVPVTEENTQLAELDGTQRAAVLMMLFGEQAAASVLRELTPGQVQDLGAAMYSVRQIHHRTIAAVVDEFLRELNEQTNIGIGAGAYVNTVLHEALGPDKAQSVLSRITRSTADHPIEIFDWMDAKAISELIMDEHPQIMALVIASIDAQLANEVLRLLPEDVQPDIIFRIATLTNVQPDALKELEQVMQRKFKANTTLRASQIGGIRSAARIMNFAKQDMEQRIMKAIRAEDKDLMENLQDNMFVFDNLVQSQDRAIQTLLREIDAEILTVALKGSDDYVKDRLLSCMSTRAAANIRDEMEAMGPIRLTAVQEAQKQVVAVARRLADAGTITLAGRGGEEMV